jgi:glucokinase
MAGGSLLSALLVAAGAGLFQSTLSEGNQMRPVEEHILVADVGGTHIGVAVMSYHGQGRFQPIRYETYLSKKTRSLPRLLRKFLRQYAGDLHPQIRRATIDFAGPVGPDRKTAHITNLDWGFTSAEITDATGLEDLLLMNDFEAVGYGVEVLLVNRPEAFVRLSRHGRLPKAHGPKPTAVVIGAGTGLGTSILAYDTRLERYRPIPGEGGHSDFIAVAEEEFRIAEWIRRNLNHSPVNPVDLEKVVSGPGLANVFQALANLEPTVGDPDIVRAFLAADPYDRPGIIVQHADTDRRCRKALDTWLRCYGRAAKNYALFPLTPGGIYLAGGVAAKVLPEMQSGVFMREFLRCDMPSIRPILKRTPVFVITDYRIGLYGCANVAINGLL